MCCAVEAARKADSRGVDEVYVVLVGKLDALAGASGDAGLSARAGDLLAGCLEAVDQGGLADVGHPRDQDLVACWEGQAVVAGLELPLVPLDALEDVADGLALLAVDQDEIFVDLLVPARQSVEIFSIVLYQVLLGVDH